MADRSQIEEIKDRIDIVELARDYLNTDFKRSGRNTFTLCPFHSEKSPSFSLNSELGIYKCFGCGESGDIFNFIEKMEGLDFSSALKVAAEKAGIKLKKNTYDKHSKKRDTLFSLNSKVAEFFHYLLMKHKAGNHALEYLKERGIEEKQIKRFNLGYAPKGFDNLKKYLKKKTDVSEDQLVKYGFLSKKNNHTYDKFRNRVMFPIHDHKGRIVGFSGRIIDPEDIPKYLNSPETLVYKKSAVLYGLYHAKESIRKKDFSIIAEGNVEPLVSSQVGIENVVVPMGTSLTKAQLKLLKRYTDTLYFAFDSDEAGQKALLRSVRMAAPLEFNFRIINLGKYKDPDDMIQDMPHKWKTAVDNAVDLIEYLINYYSKSININSAKGKSDFVKKLAPFIKSLKDTIQIDHYIKKVADKINVDVDTVRVNIRKGENIEKGTQEEEVNAKDAKQSLNVLEYLAALVINFPEVEFNIEGINFPEQLSIIVENKEDNMAKISTKLNDEGKKILSNIAILDVPKLDTENKIKEEFNHIKEMYLQKKAKREIKELKKQLSAKEDLGEDVDEILNRIKELTSKL